MGKKLKLSMWKIKTFLSNEWDLFDTSKELKSSRNREMTIG